MNRSLMRRTGRSSIWIILGLALVGVAGLLLVLAFFEPAAVAPSTASTPSLSADRLPTQTPNAPDPETPEPSVPEEPLAATVNGYSITQSYLSDTMRLNEILGQLSGASTLDEKETLQRLIRSELILQGVEDVEGPTEAEVEGFIASLQRNWGVSDEVVVDRLEAVGLERAFLVDTIDRLLTVQAAVERLEEEGHSISDWLRERQDSAEIMVFEDLASAETTPTARSTEEAEPATSTAELGFDTPDVASDFTLDRAGGGQLTLSDQLKEGPVVLVFFERCG